MRSLANVCPCISGARAASANHRSSPKSLRDLDWQFLDVRAVQLDPVDLRGLPRIAADQTEWVPPKFLPTRGKGILFLDELTSAPQMTQAGCYQLVLDRKLGEYRASGRLGGDCSRQSCLGAWRAFRHATAVAQPFRPPRPRT